MPDLPVNPLLLDLDSELLNAAGEAVLQNAHQMFVHLRDAREFLRNSRGDRIMAKAAIVLSCAALEANLGHFTWIAERFNRVRPGLYSTPQLEYLRGVQSYVNERGDVATRPMKQSLEERLTVVPDLLARAVGRRYEFPRRSAAIRKLRQTIARRDAIVHPRWDRYIADAGWYEAAEAVDAVELYLESVHMQLHPYLAGYFVMLGTIPPGWHKNDGVDVGYRTRGKRQRAIPFSTFDAVGLPTAMLAEWRDAVVITEFALENGVEGGSEGSLLSRAAQSEHSLPRHADAYQRCSVFLNSLTTPSTS